MALGWKVMINNTELPYLVSFIAIAVCATLSAFGLKLDACVKTPIK